MGSGPPPEYDGTSPLLVLSEESGSSSHEVRCLSAPPAPRVRRRDECQPVAAFRPQVFSTSRRFAPRDALRACFISLARLGFPLQGFPFPGSRTSSRRPLTLLSLPAVFLSLAGAIRRGTGFRVLLPLEVRGSTGWLFTVRELGALLGFRLSRVLRPSVVAHVSVMPPLSSLGRGRTGRPRKPAPQGLPEPKARRVSRETCRPS